ncbi:MAG: PA0069 family radical SAM protein [Gemmatimonadota bacterium]
MGHPTIQGRGAASNPKNRFHEIEVERDEWVEAEDPTPRTRFYRDPTRTIIATNESPDVGFEASVNPYRGCEHGCSYCLHGDTLVLMLDGTASRLGDLRPGARIYGTDRSGPYPKLRPSVVLAHWSTEKPAYRVLLDDGTELVASADHRFLTRRGWKYVAPRRGGRLARWHLRIGDRLEGVGGLTPPPMFTQEYMRGYICGIVRGDGMLKSYEYEREGRSHGNQHHFRLVMGDDQALQRTTRFLQFFGVETRSFLFQQAGDRRSRLTGIRTHALGAVNRIRRLVSWEINASPDWTCGFLAGIYDAEGSFSTGRLRISNTDPAIVRETVHALTRTGFSTSITRFGFHRKHPVGVVHTLGGLREHLRFLQTVDPAISRKRDLIGCCLTSSTRRKVVFIEPAGRCDLFDITTTTGDFTANGSIAHNCYARPFHEYLDLSPGLDFETKIFVKEDAPELLRKELSARSWTPKTLVMSGVTDPYQPVERRLKITRRCLEVMAEFRNPVAIITKSDLVTRDADILAELAGHGAAAATLSITTLSKDLKRVMEPRAALPEKRLEAIRRLAEAGIPTGVNVAPVIPGLTDHEMPEILERAAEAGAVRAGWIMLRLPHAVKDLFAEWLQRHFPDRREKVLNRLRDLRGGVLYDPRYGARMRGEGPFAEQVRQVFEVSCRRVGLNQIPVELSTAAFRRPQKKGGQLGLFDGGGF